jgi:DNA-binding NarL/FixJ family response regulator
VPPITVVIADAERATRAACRRNLLSEKRIRVVREARTPMEAVAAATLKPRLLLLNESVLAGDGVSLLSLIRDKCPSTKVLLVTTRASESRILDVLAGGAQGYLSMKALPALLVKAIVAVDSGEAWVPRRMVDKIIRRLDRLSAPAAGRG